MEWRKDVKCSCDGLSAMTFDVLDMRWIKLRLTPYRFVSGFCHCTCINRYLRVGGDYFAEY